MKGIGVEFLKAVTKDQFPVKKLFGNEFVGRARAVYRPTSHFPPPSFTLHLLFLPLLLPPPCSPPSSLLTSHPPHSQARHSPPFAPIYMSVAPHVGKLPGIRWWLRCCVTSFPSPMAVGVGVGVGCEVWKGRGGG
ncbi:hypothetical protein E2C01_042068 [Portunus trituberculatus]|uniref:Uncharacterized protein n=1 Tax=Portunus trituberculatus TaxID=210409 RepID=A0A5B7FKT8_PORTR|nr:hypothetical protein [Portunus trituberculatus]